MSKEEALTRPNFGTSSDLSPTTRLITITNPDGTQTVERVPVGQPKAKPSQ
jgi:hypothetical protein